MRSLACVFALLTACMPDDAANYPVTAAGGPPVPSGTFEGTTNNGETGPDANVVNLTDGGLGDGGGGSGGDGGFGGFLDAAPPDASSPPFPEGDQIP